MKWRRNIIAGLFVLAVSAAALGGYNWYYRTYKWPRDIQVALLGSEIVDQANLLKREGYSHFGEGMFRWRYQVGGGNTGLAKQCGGQSVQTCHFAKTRTLSDGVVQAATYSRGILTLEEVWS